MLDVALIMYICEPVHFGGEAPFFTDKFVVEL